MKYLPYISTLLLFFFTNILLAQNANPWTFVEESAIEKRNIKRVVIPEKYKTIQANESSLKELLAKAPLRFSEEAKNKKIEIELPMPDGSFSKFRVENSPVMHPKLAAKYPEIQTYTAYGIDDPTAKVKLDFTVHGFHAMIRSGKHNTVFVEPYAQKNTKDYIVFYKKDLLRTSPFVCGFDKYEHAEKTASYESENKSIAGDCTLRTYRLALACTGEYATFHGGTNATVLAAMNTSMNVVNGIYETDAAITMVIVPDNEDVIFLDGNTDPYTNNSGSTMLNENQTTCDNNIGSANYDIGHVFSTGGGGIAQLFSPCSGSKARGVTGGASPVGPAFDVDYVAHEMGHQFGANHTQNNSCNRNNSTAMEPGSASTIMGYAGICTPNVQNNSDAYFHAISLQEIGNFSTGSGNNCSVNSTPGNNNPPTANAGSNYTIPGGTPFVLTGIGGDPDGTASLTYCWEQMDNTPATMPPTATNTSGPAFRSLSPVSSPSRYFPNLSDIVNNVSPTWEVLSDVNRTYDFRFTVRDNNAAYSCTEEDDMIVTVDGNSGPLLVTVPNTNLTWAALSQQTITWDVAGTDGNQVNATHVDILLSTDGGFTYPITLATNTPNDGSEQLTIPDNQTTTARVMVKGNGNIFFDISDVDFIIDVPNNDFSISIDPSENAICSPDDAVYNITIGANGTFSGNVSLSSSNIPSGANVSFSNTTVNAPGSSLFTISNTGAIAAGTYSINISGTASTGTQTEVITFIVANSSPSATSLLSPANGSTGEATSPTLSWNSDANANTYEIEVALDAGFSTIVESANALTTTSYVVSSLNPSTTYYWRVRGANECGNGVFSTPWTFETENITCNNFNSPNVPVDLPNGTASITSTINITQTGTLDDLNINIDMNHEWVGDLIFSLEHNGTTVILMDQPGVPASNFGCSNNDINATFDDEGTTAVEGECGTNPAIGGSLIPEQALSAFDGMDITGTWTLTIEDDYTTADEGMLNSWSFDMCYVPPPSNCPPTLSISDNPIPNSLYEADISILSNGKVAAGSDVRFDAGSYIELNPGFIVEANAEFEAVIENGCN